jgi:TonB family protein
MKAEPKLGRATVALVALFAVGGASCASSAARPRSAAETAAAEREWSTRARAQIRDHWNPWDVVRTAGPAGASGRPTTVLRIAVKPDGTAPRPEVVRSSGIPVLDEAAVRAVEAAVPLPAPPPELASSAGAVALELGFRVVGNEDTNVPADGDKRDSFAVIAANCEYKTPGVVEPTDVQKTVETYRRDVMTCLDGQRDTGLEAIGEVAVEFVITEAGNVFRPVVLKTRGLSRSFEGCLLNTMSRWAFAKPAGGAVKVVFPFRFEGGRAIGADFRSSAVNPDPAFPRSKNGP